jgi:predicted CXXCH cytochrome family protein
MSKTKIGLSFVMALAMMLVFSIAAMAAAPKDITFTSTTNTITLSWNANTAGASYNVYQDGVKITTTPLAEKTLVVTGLVEGQKYLFEVTEVVASVEDTVNKAKLNARTGGPAYNKGLPGYVSTDTANDNNLANANQTGTGIGINDGSTNTAVIKSEGMVKNNGSNGTHRTHGEYQNNTNSCASCHQTHTGASKSLLFKDGVYNTCTACHDGTLGFYNVFEHSNAGTFGGTAAGNMSVHLADGSVQVKAAPGGNLSANSGAWINEFNCASCHSPHGSYSDRLLHYNPNGMGLAVKTDGGIGMKNATVYNFPVPTPSVASNATSILVRGTASDFGLLAADIGGADPATTKVIYAYDLSGTSYVKSTKPWLYGYSYGNPNKSYYTRFWVTAANTKVAAPDNTIKTEDDGTQHFQGVVDSHDQDWNANLKIQWNKGFIYAKNGDTILDNVTKGDVGRAYQVDLDLVEIAKFGDENGVPIYKSKVDSLYSSTAGGKGVKVSEYCASCHTDYLAKSGSATGTFSQAYRHTTNSDTYTCVRCHYAHGTDVTVMMDAHGETAQQLVTDGKFPTIEAANAYMLDQNPSSALKRYTNMSVCWGCHTDSKAEQLKNTDSFGDDNDPHGLNEQAEIPGITSSIGTNNIFAPTAP